MEGYLATATSEDENNFLAKLAEPNHAFIGGTDVLVEGTWEWVTGEVWDFTAWRSGEPNNDTNEDYLSLAYYDSLWNDMRLFYTYPVSCLIEWDYHPDMVRVLNVPSEYDSIQEAIDEARNHDTILVAPETYEELLDFSGKSIYVRSSDGAENTILTYQTRCDNLIKFTSGEDTAAILDGFTFSDVSHKYGLIYLEAASATIRNCRFINNSNLAPSPSTFGTIGMFNGDFLIVENSVFDGNQSHSAAGIGVYGGQGRFTGNTFKNNIALAESGGAISVTGTFQIENNLFHDNSAENQGGTIYLDENENTEIRGNTFARNISTGEDGGGICIGSNSSGIIIENNIFYKNSGYGVTNLHGSEAGLDCNLVWENTPAHFNGDIVPGDNPFLNDPYFCNPSTNDFYLDGSSVCAPENNSCNILIGALGIKCFTDVVSLSDNILPKKFSLGQNYPNPFNPSTTIGLALPRSTDVVLEIYNILGKKVATPINETLDAGHYNIIWDGTNSSGQSVSSGIYLYRITAGEYKEVRKMTLIK